MPPAAQLTPAQVEELVQLYEDGTMGINRLSAYFHTSASRIYAFLEEHGVERRDAAGGGSPAFVGREEEVVRRYQDGSSLSSLSREFGSAVETVKRMLEERGIEIRKNTGGRPSDKRRLMLERARELAVERAPEDVRCAYRPTEYRVRAQSSDGEKQVSRSSLIRPPMCGRPVKVTLEGDRHPLCELHQSARKDYADSAEEIAIRGRAELTQSCGRCGLSWTTTALRAAASWQAHQRRCEARSEAA